MKCANNISAYTRKAYLLFYFRTLVFLANKKQNTNKKMADTRKLGKSLLVEGASRV